jgi:hypothetical protein
MRPKAKAWDGATVWNSWKVGWRARVADFEFAGTIKQRPACGLPDGLVQKGRNQRAVELA